MRPRRSLMAAATAATLIACGGGSTEPVASAGLVAVNGARHPIVFASDTLTWAGFGFGAEQGSGAVYVVAGGAATPVEILSWADGQIRGVLPADVEPGPTFVITRTDSLGPLELFVGSRTAYDPQVHAWTAAAALPFAVGAAAAAGVRFVAGATVSARVVLTGGRLADGRLNRKTYLGTVGTDGRITSWQEAPDTIVPAGRRLHGMAGADRTNASLADVESVAYMVGGVDSAGRVLAETLGIGVSGAGVYSLWTPMALLPDRRAGLATTVAFGKLYAIGGFRADSLAARDVYYATVLGNGTLNGWFRGPPLPEGRAFAAAVVSGTALYVIGGQRGAVLADTVADTTQLTPTIYRIPLSPLSGVFQDTVWTELPVTLVHPRSRHTAAAVDDALVVSGGVYQGMPSAGETEYATIVGGQVTAFQEHPGATLASVAGGPVVSPASPVTWTAQGLARLALLGGRVAGAPTSQTWSY